MNRTTLRLLSFLIGALSWIGSINATEGLTKDLGRPYEVSEIIGTHVMTPDGLYLGRITDLIVNPEDHISLAVLSEGGFFTLNERRVALPFDVFSYKEKEKYFVLNISREKLDAAPAFSKKDLSDQTWAGDVYRYYGLQPSWTEVEAAGAAKRGECK